MPAGFVVLVLSLLLGIQPVTTDLYLPALPSLTETLGAPVSQAQLTLTLLLLAFGSSQLVWGPLSDRFGRRPVLLVGLGLYTLASIGCVVAPSFAWLVVWRTLQGAAMGAAVMGARAIVRDLFTPETGARMMSNIPCFSRTARYSGSERPAWRMNHTGTRSAGRLRHANRNGESATKAEVTGRSVYGVG
jgi:DHA1 family bicyclomycin/chloramphenicol resistance-like MFS transporter